MAGSHHLLLSPRERGWTAVRMARYGWPEGYPRASGDGPGLAIKLTDSNGRYPRASGDGPAGDNGERNLQTLSPRERGWTVQADESQEDGAVIPARAGMDRRQL